MNPATGRRSQIARFAVSIISLSPRASRLEGESRALFHARGKMDGRTDRHKSRDSLRKALFESDFHERRLSPEGPLLSPARPAVDQILLSLSSAWRISGRPCRLHVCAIAGNYESLDSSQDPANCRRKNPAAFLGTAANRHPSSHSANPVAASPALSARDRAATHRRTA